MADLFFIEDVESVIKASVLTCILTTVANNTSNIEFVRGSLALAQAITIGVSGNWGELLKSLKRQAKIQGWIELLDEAETNQYKAVL
jgi:hypothetical protein